MSKAIHKPSAPDSPSSYEELVGKPLSEAEEAEMKFNLVNFMETLIAMDRQHQEWLKRQKDETKEQL